jgi:hypothetical protein
VEATPALLTAATDCAPPPVLVPSKVTSTLFPVCAADRKPLSVENVKPAFPDLIPVSGSDAPFAETVNVPPADGR